MWEKQYMFYSKKYYLQINIEKINGIMHELNLEVATQSLP